MKLLLVLIFLAVVGTATAQANGSVCPAVSKIACPEMRSMDCCSTSDCHGEDVCCHVNICETKCQPPIKGESAAYNVTAEKCSILQKEIMDRQSG
ncbi:hypothetical protein HNY73_022464 [Argiope bruennichi]|uniref:Uncharacterized protein n=1 Tax=Argiope bruennichi TaxID=94029 RepID=A0A8T0E0R5_ARGBR|nr:hypothetical protein HNY73_022464 [Argiope bruennichi]